MRLMSLLVYVMCDVLKHVRPGCHYHTHIHTHCRFTSFKKIAAEMGLVDTSNTHRNAGLQLISFHSTSKGFTGG